MRTLPRPLQAGFTLIEIMVIAPIVILAIGAFVTVIISMTGEVLASRASNLLSYNLQDAMNRMDQDVRQSTSFIAQNNITLTAGEAQGYNNDATNFTNVGGTSGTSLILNMLVTNGNPVSTTSGVVYLKDQPNACASDQVQDNVPMTMNVVYFVKDNTLWRRTIMPSNYASALVGCSTPWQQPSCAPGYTASFCKTNDIKLVEGVSSGSFFVQYFTSANAENPNAPSSDTGSSTEVRNAALSSTTTASISINASQSVAGRTIDRSATLRTTRLETNASVIAPTTVNTTPSTPVVTGKLISGENATFTWPRSSGNNVVYDVDYNINGGAWTTALDDSGNLSYSRAALRNQTVNVRVRGSNSAGTSSYGTASVLVPLWNNPTLLNNWTNYDPVNWAPAAYTKTNAGIVMLKGLIKRTGAAPTDELLFTLPEGFRPAYQMIFQIGINPTVGRMFVLPNGEVRSITVEAGYTSLNDISFVAATAGYTPTTMTTANSWVTYSALYGTPSYIVDSAGRTNTQGLLKNGSTTGGAIMVNVPTALLPQFYTYYPVGSAAGYGYALLNTPVSSAIVPGTVSATYTGINMRFYPASRPAGSDCTISWCGLTLGSSWVQYNASTHQIAQYTKGTDDIVTLRGIIKNGTVTSGTVITTLPVGYRPKERILLQGVCNGTYCRMDILPNGQLVTNVGVSASWTAFDGMSYMAEQ